MKTFIGIIFLVGSALASQAVQAAGLSIVTCQAFDNFGHEVSEESSFMARARMSRSIQITEDGIAYIRWSYHTSPVEILLQRNPHYPFNIPFTTTDLARLEIAPGNNGLIDGEIDLGVIQEGYKLVCKQTPYQN
jgi:hypothetical protein